MPSLLSTAALLGLLSLVSSIPTCKNCEKMTTRSTAKYLITDFDKSCTGDWFITCKGGAPYSMKINYTPSDSKDEKQGPAVHGAKCSGSTSSLMMHYKECDAPYTWITTSLRSDGYVGVRMDFKANGHDWDGKGTTTMEKPGDRSLEIVPDLSRNWIHM